MKSRLAVGCIVLTACHAYGCASGGSDANPGPAGEVEAGPEASPKDASVEEAAPLDLDSSQTESDASDAADVVTEDASFCTGSGPIVQVGDTTTQHATCTGTIAASIFTNAMCTCHDATFGGYLRTRGFNSGINPDAGNAVSAAPVGIDGQYSAAGYTDIAGAFEISGVNPTIFAGLLTTADDFRAVGNTTLVGDSIVDGDGWLGGTLFSIGPVTIKGDLHHPNFLMIATPLDVGGQDITGPINLKPACDCDPAHLLDVANIVQQGKLNNDNASIGLSVDEFSNVQGIVDKTLPCGGYYLSKINVFGKLTLHTSARIALFVDGDITDVGILNVDLSGGGEIDVFASGTLHLTGTASFGDKAHPAATRIYVGSSQDVTLIGYDQFVGNLYAPKAKVYMPGYIKLFGSLFVGDYISGSYTDLTYDAAIEDAGQDCPVPPPATCEKCGTCTGGTACVSGTCGACSTNDDCCGLKKCVNGACANVIQ